MDLDSLLPPALSESLHIPPWLPWLLEAQALSGAWLLSPAMKTYRPSVTHKQNNNREIQLNDSCLFRIFLAAVSVIFGAEQSHGYSRLKMSKQQTVQTVDFRPKAFPWLRKQSLSGQVPEKWRIIQVYSSVILLMTVNLLKCYCVITHFVKVDIKRHLLRSFEHRHLVYLCCCWTSSLWSLQAGAADCPLRLR